MLWIKFMSELGESDGKAAVGAAEEIIREAQRSPLKRTIGTAHEPPRPVSTEEYISILTLMPEWKKLQPNYQDHLHLPPQNLTNDQIMTIVERVGMPPIADLKHDQPYKGEIPGVGKIRKIGQGELNTAFLLETAEGKRLVTQLQIGYSAGPRIPQDRKISPYEHKPLGIGNEYEESAFYSGARTYLQLPTTINGSPYGVILQEYLGNSRPGLRDYFARNRSRKEVEFYVRSRGYTIEAPYEFGKPEHAFVLQGNYGSRIVDFADIPLIRQIRLAS